MELLYFVGICASIFCDRFNSAFAKSSRARISLISCSTSARSFGESRFVAVDVITCLSSYARFQSSSTAITSPGRKYPLKDERSILNRKKPSEVTSVIEPIIPNIG